jgi:hypothetical protein
MKDCGAYVNRGILYAGTGRNELAASAVQNAYELGNKAERSAGISKGAGKVKGAPSRGLHCCGGRG